jgi:hypothetical protein
VVNATLLEQRINILAGKFFRRRHEGQNLPVFLFPGERKKRANAPEVRDQMSAVSREKFRTTLTSIIRGGGFPRGGARALKKLQSRMPSLFLHTSNRLVSLSEELATLLAAPASLPLTQEIVVCPASGFGGGCHLRLRGSTASTPPSLFRLSPC